VGCRVSRFARNPTYFFYAEKGAHGTASKHLPATIQIDSCNSRFLLLASSAMYDKRKEKKIRLTAEVTSAG
jgi:hypothetical protein